MSWKRQRPGSIRRSARKGTLVLAWCFTRRSTGVSRASEAASQGRERSRRGLRAYQTVFRKCWSCGVSQWSRLRWGARPDQSSRLSKKKGRRAVQRTRVGELRIRILPTSGDPTPRRDLAAAALILAGLAPANRRSPRRTLGVGCRTHTRIHGGSPSHGCATAERSLADVLKDDRSRCSLKSAGGSFDQDSRLE